MKEYDLRRAKRVIASVSTAGLATEAKQDSQITQLATIITNTTGLNLEVTQLLVKSVLDTIKLDTANLDVALSTIAKEATLLTRLSKADFEARINTLGQKVMASSTPVVIASDQTPIPVTSNGATASVASIAQAIVSTLLIASNTSRKEVYIHNTASKNLWVSHVSPAVVGKGLVLAKGETLIEDRYSGALYGIWDGTGTDNAQVTQITT